ncbi:hypothetical protein ACOMHN_025040 [Nucella lapillus]
MEYLPWDNPDNIVSANVEKISRRVKDFALTILFLIGGPGNVINMAVFYKQGLKDRVNLCLFSLALADELYFIAAMCHFAEQVHLQFTTSESGLTLVAPCGLRTLRLRQGKPQCGCDGGVEMSDVGAVGAEGNVLFLLVQDKKSSGLKAEREKNHDHHPVSVDQVCKSGVHATCPCKDLGHQPAVKLQG